MQKSGRLPQAPASLLVQLPPDELQKFQNVRADIRSVHSDSEVIGVQASDLQLLATSIQQRREREERVFTWQQRLIDADEELSQDDLKRALTQLSLSSWLQVLQERHLDNRCAYPTCSRRPIKAHISARDTILPLDAPRYRISLATRTIQRDERDDPGGENGYCTKACWRRGEWVSRWVLEGSSASRMDQEKRALVGDQREFGSVRQDSSNGLGNQVDEGGRWERLIEEDLWQKIELLEDLEESGEVDRLSDDESMQHHSSRRLESRAALKHSEADAKDTAKISNISPSQVLQKGLDDFSSMLDSLAIVERPSGQTSTASVMPSTAQEQPISREKTGRVRLVDRNGKAAIEGEDVEQGKEDVAEISDVDSDDMDVLAELSMRTGMEGEHDIVSTILESSRGLQRIDDDGIGSHNKAEDGLTEEELKQLQEEDDLFALAWQARDEEIAKGSWVE
ncbi:hypothetical protein CBS101457_001590 [Exobasidium rhododendri]|nr:hypothetical protein CBS101457_001590 [Exobasidium rhododendri]